MAKKFATHSTGIQKSRGSQKDERWSLPQERTKDYGNTEEVTNSGWFKEVISREVTGS